MAAGSFGKEITAPVLWLRDEYGIDVTCVELTPLQHEDKILINSRIIIPVPETEDYMAKRREKQEEQESTEISETEKMQKKFWQEFKKYMEREGTFLSLRKPRPQHWYEFAVGKSNFHVSLITNTQKNRVRSELYIEKKGSERIDALMEDKKEIENEIGAELDWQRIEEKEPSRIAQYKDFDLYKDEWDEIFPWLKERAETFHEVFSPRIQNL